MREQTIKKISDLPKIYLHIGIACSVGLLLGLASTLISPMWALIGLLVGWCGIIAILHAEVLVLLYLILTSSILVVSHTFSVSLGFGSLYLTDAILLLSFALLTIRLLVEPNFKVIHTPLDWFLVIFLLASVSSTAVAIFNSSLYWKQSLGELRVVLGYILFFIVTNLIRKKEQILWLIWGILLIAAVVAAATIAQYLLGQSQIILAGRVEMIGSEGGEFARATRVIPPGQSIMLVAFTAIFAILMLDQTRLSNFSRMIHLGLVGLGIVTTFFRASWVAIALSIFLMGFLVNRQQRKKYLLWIFTVTFLSVILVILLMFQPESPGAILVRAAFGRAGTMTETQTYEDANSSLRWRDFEYQYALPQIISHPVLGLGMGATYRPWTSRDHELFDGRTYIHNGHLYIMLKAGVVGYLGLLFFIIFAMTRGLKNWRKISDPYLQAIVLAFSLAFMEILMISFVEPYLITPSWTPLIGVIAGVNEAIFYTQLPKR